MQNKKHTKTTKNKDLLENTTRIRIDSERINDADSLDVSFIDGRKSRKIKKNKKAREKILKESKDYSIVFSIIKFISFILLIIGIIYLGKFIIDDIDLFEKKENKSNKIIKSDEKVMVVDNYLFVGDFYIDDMNFEDFMYPYVKVSNRDYTTLDLLENMEDNIYKYNPSDVFIEIGMNDLNNGVSLEEIISNLEEIILGIKSNRKYANIYIESLYPINSDYDIDLREEIDNELIKKLNKKIENLTKSLEVKYIDMYNELSYEDSLKDNYSSDGIHLNDIGYEKIFKIINRIVDEKNGK